MTIVFQQYPTTWKEFDHPNWYHLLLIKGADLEKVLSDLADRWTVSVPSLSPIEKFLQDNMEATRWTETGYFR